MEKIRVQRVNNGEVIVSQFTQYTKEECERELLHIDRQIERLESRRESIENKLNQLKEYRNQLEEVVKSD